MMQNRIKLASSILQNKICYKALNISFRTLHYSSVYWHARFYNVNISDIPLFQNKHIKILWNNFYLKYKYIVISHVKHVLWLALDKIQWMVTHQKEVVLLCHLRWFNRRCGCCHYSPNSWHRNYYENLE